MNECPASPPVRGNANKLLTSGGRTSPVPVVFLLEELDFGGTQTQTLELADRGFYRNHLLERSAQRHTDAVRLMSWLFTSGFSSEQLWDRIEEYFLGLPIQGFDAPSAESR